MRVLTIALSTLTAATAFAQDYVTLEARGGRLLNTYCAGCHAIGTKGQSPHPEAPPFRTLATRYPIENLAEGLAEGLSSGHPDMPEFVFDVQDVAAILAYLQSIQQPVSDKSNGSK